MWQTLRWPKWSHPGTAKPGRRSYIACTRSTEMVKSSDPTQHITSIASMDIYGTSAGKALFYHALSDLQLCPEFYLHRTRAAHLQVTALRAFIMYDLIPNVSHKIKPDKGGTKARTLLARSGRVSTQEKINKEYLWSFPYSSLFSFHLPIVFKSPISLPIVPKDNKGRV